MTGLRSRNATSRGGFTLFEVLAAVLVLAFVFTWLAAMNIEGLRAEGTSRRRLEASLLADASLAAVEEQLVLGAAPPLGDTEQTVGDYGVLVSVTPLDITPFLGEDAAPPEGATESLLTLPNTGDAAFLRRIDVVVRWMESFDEFQVHRSTFAYDTETLASFFPDEGSGEGGDAGGPVDPEEEMTEAPTMEDLQRLLGESQQRER